MWGAWVVMKDGRQDWGWHPTVDGADPIDPYSFVAFKKDIMPTVKAYRETDGVKSCTPVKVPLPEGPADE